MKIIVLFFLLSVLASAQPDIQWDSSAPLTLVLGPSNQVNRWDSNDESVGRFFPVQTNNTPVYVPASGGIGGHSAVFFNQSGLKTVQISLLAPYYLALVFQSFSDGFVMTQTWNTGPQKMFSVNVNNSYLDVIVMGVVVSNNISIGNDPLLLSIALDQFSFLCTVRVNGTVVAQKVHVQSASTETAPLVMGGTVNTTDWQGWISYFALWGAPLNSYDTQVTEDAIMTAWF